MPSFKIVGHVTYLINKNHEAIENLKNTKKVLCLAKQLNFILEKLIGTIFNFIWLSASPEEIENANKILYKENS